MNLNLYLKTMTVPEREVFAAKCQASLGHLQNVAYGYKPCAEKLAVRIEKNSHKAVLREELCPDWMDIWPELIRLKRSRSDQPVAQAA